jgi:hypothetical protein
MRANVDATRRSTSMFWHGSNGILNENCEARWNGRYGTVDWSTWSTVLNYLDFFLWGSMKSRVRHTGKPEERRQSKYASVGI